MQTLLGLLAAVAVLIAHCYAGPVPVNVTLPGDPCAQAVCAPRAGCKALHRGDACCPLYQCECQLDGRLYNDGDKLLDPRDPCRVCYCQGGEVVCRRVACFRRDDCAPRTVPGRCCPEYDNCPLTDGTAMVTAAEDASSSSTPALLAPKQEITIKEITPVSEIPAATAGGSASERDGGRPLPVREVTDTEQPLELEHNPAFPPLPDDLTLAHRDDDAPDTESDTTATPHTPLKASPMLNLRAALPTGILNMPSAVPEDINGQLDDSESTTTLAETPEETIATATIAGPATEQLNIDRAASDWASDWASTNQPNVHQTVTHHGTERLLTDPSSTAQSTTYRPATARQPTTVITQRLSSELPTSPSTQRYSTEEIILSTDHLSAYFQTTIADQPRTSQAISDKSSFRQTTEVQSNTRQVPGDQIRTSQTPGYKTSTNQAPSDQTRNSQTSDSRQATKNQSSSSPTVSDQKSISQAPGDNTSTRQLTKDQTRTIQVTEDQSSTSQAPVEKTSTTHVPGDLIRTRQTPGDNTGKVTENLSSPSQVSGDQPRTHQMTGDMPSTGQTLGDQTSTRQQMTEDQPSTTPRDRPTAKPMSGDHSSTTLTSGVQSPTQVTSDLPGTNQTPEDQHSTNQVTLEHPNTKKTLDEQPSTRTSQVTSGQPSTGDFFLNKAKTTEELSSIQRVPVSASTPVLDIVSVQTAVTGHGTETASTLQVEVSTTTSDGVSTAAAAAAAGAGGVLGELIDLVGDVSAIGGPQPPLQASNAGGGRAEPTTRPPAIIDADGARPPAPSPPPAPGDIEIITRSYVPTIGRRPGPTKLVQPAPAAPAAAPAADSGTTQHRTTSATNF